MTIENLRDVITDTARQLEKIAANLQAAIDGSVACGCDSITFERSNADQTLVVRCNRGRETRINMQYAQLMLINNEDVIQHIALVTSKEHGLDADRIARELRGALNRRDGTSTIKVG